MPPFADADADADADEDADRGCGCGAEEERVRSGWGCGWGCWCSSFGLSLCPAREVAARETRDWFVSMGWGGMLEVEPGEMSDPLSGGGMFLRLSSVMPFRCSRMSAIYVQPLCDNRLGFQENGR